MINGKPLGNLLVLTYWDFRDPLVQTYTLPYLGIIQRHQRPTGKIFLLTLERDEKFQTTKEGVKLADQLDKKRIVWLPRPYKSFGLVSLVRWLFWLIELRKRIRRDHIEVIHTFATPAGAAGYLLSILTGAHLVLDSYEPHADAMVENGTWRKNGLAFWLLFRLEYLQTRRAEAVIGTTPGMLAYAENRYHHTIARFFTKPACVDLTLFSNPPDLSKVCLLEEWGWSGKIISVYAGKLGGIYLSGEVFDFLKAAADFWGDRFRFLFLTNQSREEVKQWCNASGFEMENLRMLFVPHKEVPQYLALANFAITPVKPVPSKRFCTPIKDGEYWAMGLPVVIPAGISDDSEIIRKEQIGAVLDSLNEEAYATALDTLESLFAEPKDQLQKRIRDVAIKYRNFSIAEDVYRRVYGN